MDKVLIVDDEKSIRVTLCEFLKSAGYEADAADDATMAIAMLGGKKYDVVLTDIIMPRMTGIDLLAMIQRDRKRCRLSS
jgi:CheY-like chemotaxis protein